MGLARKLAVRMLQATGMNRAAHNLYYEHLHGFESASPALPEALERCFDAAVELGVADKGGDYFEFGMFKGYSFWCAQEAANRRNLSRMRFFGFDSFSGLPDVEGIDQTERGEFYKNQYACSKAAVVRNLTSKGVDWDRTFLIEGYFRDSLTDTLVAEYSLQRAAIALIDCDLYASTVEVLRFLRPLLADNTIVVFDDWNCFGADDAKGQRRAFREFLSVNPRLAATTLFSYGDYGTVFVVKEQAPAVPFGDRERDGR